MDFDDTSEDISMSPADAPENNALSSNAINAITNNNTTLTSTTTQHAEEDEVGETKPGKKRKRAGQHTNAPTVKKQVTGMPTPPQEAPPLEPSNVHSVGAAYVAG